MTESIAGKEKLAEYFEGLLQKHGDHYLSLDWKSSESQQVRFSVLFDIIAYADKRDDISILDVGCGIAHLYDFLLELDLIKTHKIIYSGIDIAGKLIDFAKNKHPELDLRVADMLQEGIEDKYDYVFSSGIFNIKMTDMESHKSSVRKMLSKMFDACKVGASVNFLTNPSAYVSSPREGSEKFVYYTEEEVVSWLREICERFVLRRDYHPGDFTVYMLK